MNLRSSEFYGENNRKKPIKEIGTSFDLNADGQPEFISCKLWERWGRLRDCVIKTASDQDILSVDKNSFHPKRIGILAEKNNGWHSIVADFNEVIIYDAMLKKYKSVITNESRREIKARK